MKSLIIAIQRNGKIISTSYELIEAAKGLSGEIVTAILSADAEKQAADLASHGGGRVLAFTHADLAEFNDETFSNLLANLINNEKPDVVLCPATFYGKALLARLAAKIGAPMVSDITGLRLDADKVVATRPSYGGSVISDVVGNSGPLLLSVRPKVFNESASGEGSVEKATFDETLLSSKMKVIESKAEGGGKVSLTEADIVVSAGRGLKGPENLHIIQELADAMGAAMGASRAIVDAGWIEYSYQVGQTGRTVNPKLYIAVGISGAIQHLVGMRSSRTIVAINKDKDAPIFNISSYGIVGDAMEIVPALTKKFAAELA